jgi:hypothetical protein
VTNLTGGNIDIWNPAPVGAGANPYTSFEQAGTAASEIRIGYNLGGQYSNTATILGISGQLSIQSATGQSLATFSGHEYHDSGGVTFRTTSFTAYDAFSSTANGLGAPVGGLGTYPFEWSGQTTPNTVACGTGGTQTISAAQAIIPFFIVTGSGLTSNCTLDFSTNASTGHFEVGTSGLTLGATFGLVFKNGTTSSTTFTTANAVAGSTMAIVNTYGTNNLAVNF